MYAGGDSSLRWLFELQRRILAAPGEELVLDFSACTFVPHQAVAMLGASMRLCESLNGRVDVRWQTMKSAIRVNLAQNGFAAAFGSSDSPWQGNSVPFVEFDVWTSMNEIVDFLQQRWIKRGWVHCSDKLADAVCSRMCEIFLNAFEHAGSAVGAIACGQHYPTKESLSLCIVDFGIGIVENVNRFRGHVSPAREALEWAFMRGTTTRPGDTGRGLGLDIVKSFVTANRGTLRIFSNGAKATVTDHTNFANLPAGVGLQGTLIDISLRCDETLYALSDEIAVGGPFF